MIAPHAVDGTGTRTFKMLTGAQTLDAPRVLTSRWQAADGSKAQILINWTKSDISCTCAGNTVTVPAMNGLLLKE